MDKQSAIQEIRNIQNGKGEIHRDVAKELRGSLAVKLWNDNHFAYGTEYGMIAALMFAFGITANEINGK